MENYNQMLEMGSRAGAPLSSAMRSLTPSILAKRQIRQGPMDLSRFMPQEPQMQMPDGGLGSLQEMARMLLGQTTSQQRMAGASSMLGGIS